MTDMLNNGDMMPKSSLPTPDIMQTKFDGVDAWATWYRASTALKDSNATPTVTE